MKSAFPGAWKLLFTITLAAIGQVVVTAIINLPENLRWLYLFTGILLLVVSLGIINVSWIIFEKGKKKVIVWRKTPKIKHWFELPNRNDLRMFAKPAKWSKGVRVKYSVKGYKDFQGKDYLSKYRHELELLSPSRGSGRAFFIQILPSEGVEIFIGKAHGDRIALVSGDTFAHGFRDGNLELVIGCTGIYKGEHFTLPDFSIWLIISDGALIEIKKKSMSEKKNKKYKPAAF